MGVDLNVIIGHKLNAAQVVVFPKFIDNCQEFKDVFIEEIQSKIDHSYTLDDMLLRMQKKTHWHWTDDDNEAEKYLLDVWSHNGNPESVIDDGYWDFYLDTYFGWIYFYENTLCIRYSPEHKYANIFYESHRRYILKFSRAFAKILGQTKILYCSDSRDIIDAAATEGKTIEQVIDVSITALGQPPNTLKEALLNRFFVEDVNNPFEDFVGNVF